MAMKTTILTIVFALSVLCGAAQERTATPPNLPEGEEIQPYAAPSPLERDGERFRAAFRAACVPVSLDTRISLKVFHCPQAGHLPIHLGDSCPQFSQTNIVLSFAMELLKC